LCEAWQAEMHNAPAASSLDALAVANSVQAVPAPMSEDVQQAHAPNSKGVTMALDLAAGTAAGTAQLLVGHPFDTIKVNSKAPQSAPAHHAVLAPTWTCGCAHGSCARRLCHRYGNGKQPENPRSTHLIQPGPDCIHCGFSRRECPCQKASVGCPDLPSMLPALLTGQNAEPICGARGGAVPRPPRCRAADVRQRGPARLLQG
jgi:hypothetical protein